MNCNKLPISLDVFEQEIKNFLESNALHNVIFSDENYLGKNKVKISLSKNKREIKLFLEAFNESRYWIFLIKDADNVGFFKWISYEYNRFFDELDLKSCI